MNGSYRSASFERVNYAVRPSKQVERKLFIEVLHRLAEIGCQTSDYTYIGLGSVFYTDFILFHRYLYVDRMICAEQRPIPKRMRFNRPYGFIRVKMSAVSELVPTLSARRKYLVWLDYDHGLDASTLQDIDGFASRLAPGSVLIVTVDAEPPRFDETLVEWPKRSEWENAVCGKYQREIGDHVSGRITRDRLAKNELPRLFAEAIRSQLKTTVTRRGDARFLQLFNYRYADGAQMLTVGGLIGDSHLGVKLAATDIYDLDYVRNDAAPILISVPPLTMKEKGWLDQKIGARSRFGRLPFELDKQMLKNYRKFYRHYPEFHEAVL